MIVRAPVYCDIGELLDVLFRRSPFIPFTSQLSESKPGSTLQSRLPRFASTVAYIRLLQ
jgi:hypothetical protein